VVNSDYAAKVFGFATFGKVYGLIICLAGLLNFSQTALDALTHRTFNNNPIPVNVMLLSLALIIGLALVAFVWTKSRQGVAREGLEDEAEGARESLMPAANGVGVSDYGAVNGATSPEERGRSRA
jgi:multisubunit Na+/H+ antiporter MnhC subunit